MHFGKVKWFDRKKGFGFIESPAGDIFVHYTQIFEMGFKTLKQGGLVTFDVVNTQRGLQAQNIICEKREA